MGLKIMNVEKYYNPEFTWAIVTSNEVILCLCGSKEIAKLIIDMLNKPKE
jgi:hypothetical protein